jgi:DNA-binding response OmpR family regulator
MTGVRRSGRQDDAKRPRNWPRSSHPSALFVCVCQAVPHGIPYVLLLEDHQQVADMLREAFRAEGYRCFVLRSKATAERFLRRVRPDLVIVDHSLIGGNGLEAAQMATEANVPVIVTSGHLDVRDAVEDVGLLFVQKPFRVEELMAIARQLIGCGAARQD